MKHSSFFQGTIILTAAGLLIKFSGFFYKIFLARVLGAEGMGIYQLIFPVFAVCHSLTSSGIETAVSRFTACASKKERPEYFFAALSLTIGSSVFIGILLFTHAGLLAEQVLREPRCIPLLKVLAVTVPLAGIHGCFSGYCLGQKNALFPALSQLTEQAVRIGSVWLLYQIFLQEGISISPLLAVLGLLCGEIASVLFMLTFASEGALSFSAASYVPCCRALLSMALPITCSRVSLTFLQSAESILIPLTLHKAGLCAADALSLYGILTGMSLSLLLFPNAVTASLSAMLLPAISEEQACGRTDRISQTIEYTLLFGINMGILCMGIFLRFGQALGTFCFQQPLAGTFLRTLAWICPLLYLSGNLNSILHGLGRSPITFFNQLAALLLRILCILLFAPTFGIQGILWSTLAGELLCSFLGIRAVASYIQPTIGLDAYVLKPAAAVLLSAGGIHMLKPASDLFTLFLHIVLMCLCSLLLLCSFGLWKLLRPLFYINAAK